MIYGYARCSTNEKKQDIRRQVRELTDVGVLRDNIYLEYESGTNNNRTEFNRLFNDTVVDGDTIVTTEVSRLTRSMQQLCKIIDIVEDKKLKLVILNTITIDCSKGNLDPMTKAFLQMNGIFVELEKNIISQRVKSGMANAKANGSKIGRPEVTKEDIPATFYKHYPTYKTCNMNVTEFARVCQMSRTTIYKYINIVENS